MAYYPETKTNYSYVQQFEWISKALCWVKKSGLKNVTCYMTPCMWHFKKDKTELRRPDQNSKRCGVGAGGNMWLQKGSRGEFWSAVELLYILMVVVIWLQIWGPWSPSSFAHSSILIAWNLGMGYVLTDTVKECSGSSPDSSWHPLQTTLYLACSPAAYWTSCSWKASPAPLHSPGLVHRISPPGKQCLQLSYSLKSINISDLRSLLLLLI